MTTSPSPSFDALRASTVDDLTRLSAEAESLRARIGPADEQVTAAKERLTAARSGLGKAQRDRRELGAELDRVCDAFAKQRLWLTLVHEKLGMPDDDPVADPRSGSGDAGDGAAGDASAGFGAFNLGTGSDSEG